jgi:hypothetical protein
MNGLEESSCKPVEQKENHEKGPRGSWAGNQMGNPELNLKFSRKNKIAAYFSKHPVRKLQLGLAKHLG